jgi:hypothetical protein
MTTLSGNTDAEKLADLSSKNYKAQAIWFLNAFWPEHGQHAEKIWKYKHTFDELDLERKADGCALDELQVHRFLEKYSETLTVQAMREKLRATGAIGSTIRLVPLIHILIFKYNVNWHELVNAPQGNKEEVLKAQALLDEVQAAFFESEQRDAEAAAALRESQAREAEAKRDEAAAKKDEAAAKAREAEAKAREAEAIEREEEARRQEAPFKAAQEEVDAALAEVKSQEESRNRRTEELKRKSTEGGVVQQNKAKNELAQHLAEDPLPLRKAKITLEAALKKAEKARAPFEAATREAEAARAVAEEAAAEASSARAAAEKSARAAEDARRRAEAARQKSEEAKEAAEAALEEARRRLEEAEAYLEEAKKRLPEGQIWWLDRELQERRKYLPKSKGGVDK